MEFNDEENMKNESAGRFNSVSFTWGIISGMVFIAVAFAVILFFKTDLLGAAFSPKNPEAKSSGMAVEEKLEHIFRLLDKNYVNEYDKAENIEDMYRGLIYSLGDPYTTYFTPDQYDKFMEETSGTYAGIGVSVSVSAEDNSIVIIVPFEGYPGARAGLMPGDRIIKVNDTDVTGDMLDYAVSIMKGTPGTSVNVTFWRESDNSTFEREIIRETINVPTVSHKMLDDNIGYLRITQFDRVTYDQFMDAYKDLKFQNMTGLVLDLRNNPGGLLNIVSSITDELVPQGLIVYTEDKNGKKEYSRSNAKAIDIPLVVLVNGNSASASEVLSGAVKDHGVGKIVGTTTYGKALVQNIFPLPDGSALKITIAKYYTPNGTLIQGEGITPDYEIEMSDELSMQISSLTLDEDVQLQKAVDVIKGLE